MAAKELVSTSSLESINTEDHHHHILIRAMDTRSPSSTIDRFPTVEDSALLSKEEEIDILLSRVNTATALLSYLKSKATSVAAADFANLSLGTDQLQLSLDGTFVTEMLNHVDTVTGVMESLARRAIIAESQAATEKAKLVSSQEEIQRKVGQIDNMSTKLEDMEKFALGTSSILCEMRQRVDDLVQETSRQKLRATENELELSRVRRDFESLKSYVTSLISVRETLVSSEKQFQTIERLFEQLACLLQRQRSWKARKYRKKQRFKN
ncbi:PREDICTED: uncharacterized protein LOC104762950 isoform X2 [Camelina sativa]|uniref:Uncharacterized protein LOC104762950 isoform X2 n=1 Tax=Camelina sativa TaxID=90675 RepID=A0ABM0XED2_CAMSA|nr:PREDICTED: uncharacterized protein LOC104762950 isoform X2 [Camelina sativa]